MHMISTGIQEKNSASYHGSGNAAPLREYIFEAAQKDVYDAILRVARGAMQ